MEDSIVDFLRMLLKHQSILSIARFGVAQEKNRVASFRICMFVDARGGEIDIIEGAYPGSLSFFYPISLGSL